MQTTFPQLLFKHAAQRPGDPAMREKEYGIWQALSWADLAAMVTQLACGLHQAGLRRGQHMVVVGANRPRLYATMLAAQSLGAVLVHAIVIDELSPPTSQASPMPPGPSTSDATTARLVETAASSDVLKALSAICELIW